MARSRRAEATALPAWIKPQLTKLVDAPPGGPRWLHEIKFDGYRMHARLDRGAVRLLTRTGLDWTHKYPAIASAVASLPARQAYLDGELCGVRPDGTTSFSLIQNACSGRDARGGPECSSNLSKRICRTPCSTSVRPIPRPSFERSKTGQITRYKNWTDHESPTGDELQAASQSPCPHASGVFVVSNKGAAAMRTASDQGQVAGRPLSYAACYRVSPIAIRRGLLPGPIAGWKTRQ